MMSDFNPIFVEDVLTISKESLENAKLLSPSFKNILKIKKLETNEFIGSATFNTVLCKYKKSNKLTIVLCHSFGKPGHNFEANVMFTVQSANYTVKAQRCSMTDHGKGWSTNLCTLSDALNPAKNFLVNGELVIRLQAMIYDNPYLDGQEKLCSSVPKKLWTRDDRDFIIVVGPDDHPKTEVKIHKLILALHSPVFDRMLETEMEEKAKNRLEIIDFTAEVVQAAVEYFYDRDTFKSLNVDNLIGLLLFADKYDINDLKAELAVEFMFRIYPDNIVDIANASIMANSPKLRNICIKSINLYISQNIPYDDAENLDEFIEKALKYDTVPQTFLDPE